MYQIDDLVEARICGLRIRFKIESSLTNNFQGSGHWAFNPLCGKVFITTNEIIGFYHP